MKRILPLLLSLMFSVCLFSQNVSGLIIDNSKEKIAGAYVVVSSTENHTHSDDFGKFMIENVKIGDSLKIIHIGYEPKTVIVENFDEKVTIELVESYFELGELTVKQSSKEVNVISAIDIQLSPVRSSQELLKKVPGLFIGQHAGGGKAEQIFLRGFDIDHGTDVSISVDGIPVNMVSHAHGQGYADMHFVIPETVELMDFGKGPYYADKGNFTTAGYVEFTTKEKLDNSQISLEAGRFNSMRTVGLFKLLDTEKQDAYIATEYMISDGPFESSQHFSRNNILGKYTTQLNNGGQFSILASYFSSKWDASGQVPERAVDQGLITRFGAIDDTEGGETNRTNIAVSFNRILSDNTFIKNRIYFSKYDFTLFFNFTFFLNDPINGDQIRQRENRQIYGGESVFNYATSVKGASTLFQLGAGLRSDKITDNELSRTLNRKTLVSNIQLGDVDEKNLYTFARAEFDVGNWLFEPSVRFDFFKFNYVNSLDTLYQNQSQSKGIVTPKFNILYNLNNSVQLFFKSGIGFHSNDARVVLEQDNRAILPAAYGADIGSIFKPTRRMIANVAFWYLSLDQEFVYVGDEGVVEPSGSTRRVGVDIGLRYQLNDWIFANADFNYAFARSLEDPEGQNLIPLAPIITSTAGLNFKKDKFRGSLQLRYLQDRPANEDNSIEAEGYSITDLNLSYDVKNMTFGIAIENLFNQEWNETQFATESRLRNETEAVEEIHFTPGSPFFIKGIFTYKF